jgi:tRNA pseudouridine38-40 synthase
VQPGVRTVQGELQRALAVLCREPVRTTGAGRTDAGVHALQQVASFDAEAAPEPRRFLRGLNALLPPDVHAYRLAAVVADFSARGSALSRHYRYRMLVRPEPLRRRDHHVLRSRVDVAAMAAAAALLEGEHDFTAFAARDSAGESRVCRVLQATVAREDGVVVFSIAANRFLHNMVRRLAGALVEVGRGRCAPAELARILTLRDATRGGPCLPPQGLALVEVRYPPGLEIPGTAVVDGGAGDP